jgi:N-acyl-D-aspartate/D-glutamate deacylase
MLDLVLKGGRIYDGSGLPSYCADVGVRAGRITSVGRVDEPARRVLNVEGLAVAPGFIDMHTHLDAQVFWDPLASSSNEHGVTSVVVGNCALTLAPCKPEDHDALVGMFCRVEAMPRSVLAACVPWEWTTHAEYLTALAKRPLGLNVATFVGHCAVRQYVMGDASTERPATDDEIGRMEDLVRQGMAAGAFGFSTNYNDRHFCEDGRPIPSRLAEPEETTRLCHAAAEGQHGVLQFTRGGFHVLEHMDWYRQLARETGRPLIWQGLLHQWARPDLWKRMLGEAAEGFRQGAAAYPLTNARPFSNRWTMKNAQVFDELPTWRALLFLPLEERLKAFADPDVRAKMRFEAVEDRKPINFSRRWDLVYIRQVQRPEHTAWVNRSVAELAAAEGKDVIDAFLDLALSEDLDTLFENSEVQGDPQAVAAILADPYVLIGQSDAGAHLAYDAGFGYSTTFLGAWVRDRGVLPLEEAVRKLTFMPASIFGLHDRGLLRPGLAADIAVFDPATVGALDRELVHDLPGGEPRYVQHARGVHYTVVNGEVLMEGGEHAGAYPGRVLRSTETGVEAVAA